MHHLAFAVEDGVANALAEAEPPASVSLTKLRVKVLKVCKLLFTSQINFGRPDRALRKP